VNLEQLTSADAVREAVSEFDQLGRDAFLERYGFGRSRTHFLSVGDRLYDSKAIVGAAHGYEHPQSGPLRSDQFSGGAATVGAKLRELGFEVVTEAPAEQPIHLVVKWSARLGSDTVERHIEVATARGAVWWGLYSSEPGRIVAMSWTSQLREQLADDVETFVFLSGPTFHRSRLLGVEYEADAIDRELIPASYRHQLSGYHLWVKLTDIEPVEKDWLMAELEPARKPGTLITLSNQTNPLYVRLRSRPRYWWVNQGASYRRAREGGYIWAPERDRRGAELPHWRAMRYLRPGDVVLNYANTLIRAVSRVLFAAEPNRRPEEDADQAWNEDGYLARLEYRDIPPISLPDIPEEWRLRERGPFTSDARVQQGYLFPLSDQFITALSQRFTQLNLDPPRVSILRRH
jgi:hypothetical protein